MFRQDTHDLILYWTFSCPSHEITEYVGRLSGTRSEIKLLDEASRSGSKYDLDFLGPAIPQGSSSDGRPSVGGKML